MAKILITGGCGYIGSHTAIEILQEGRYGIVSVDNFSNSSTTVLDRIQSITGQEMKNYSIDLCHLDATRQVFIENPDIVGVIHFAASKSVGESVEKPLDYYNNNFTSLINILRSCEEFGVRHVIFSSSCSVYGNIDTLPVTEETPLADRVESPYANTKRVGEQIMSDFLATANDMSGIALRYFNPVGGHVSGLNGELPINRPSNLVPVITQVASGIIPKLTVFGSDYDTRDGSCIRDYIHVTDIAIAHIKAMDYLLKEKNEEAYEFFNLGSGDGVTVLEAIEAFERNTGLSLNYEIGPRRPGDVGAIYSDSSKALERFGWETQFGIDEMMTSAWKWQETLNSERLSV